MICPYCKEEIQDKATICRYCHRRVKTDGVRLIVSFIVLVTIAIVVRLSWGTLEVYIGKMRVALQDSMRFIKNIGMTIKETISNLEEGLATVKKLSADLKKLHL